MNQEMANRRARAAWAFSGKNQRQLAQESGISYDRLREMLRLGTRSKISLEELLALADATGVPEWFMKDGWDGAAVGAGERSAFEQRLARVEEALRRGGTL